MKVPSLSQARAVTALSTLPSSSQSKADASAQLWFGWHNMLRAGECAFASCSCIGESPPMGFSARCNLHLFAPELCRLYWAETVFSFLLDEPTIAFECTLCSQIPRTQWRFINNDLFLFGVSKTIEISNA